MRLIDCKMPRPVQKGSTFGLLSLCSPVEKDRLQSGIRYLVSQQCLVYPGKSVLAKRGYLAGYDEQRVADLHMLYGDTTIEGILASKGGYGSGRLLDKIDWRLLKENPKAFIGFSDITAFQLALLQKTGLGSYYGPMVSVDMRHNMPDVAEQSFWKAVAGQAQTLNGRSMQPGKADGVLVGGCLSVLTSIMGSPYFPDMRGAILFLEEVGEAPYRVDRHLNQLRLAGVFKKIAGLALGRFVHCTSNHKVASQTNTPSVLRELAKSMKVPVVSDLPFGHVRDKMTIPLGKPATLDGGRGTLYC